MTQTKFWQKWLLLYFFFSVTLCPQRLCGLFGMGNPGPTPTLTFTQPLSSDSLLYVYSVDTSTSLERKMDALAKSSYICQQTDVGSSLLQLTFLFRSCLWTPLCDFAPKNWINEMLKRLTATYQNAESVWWWQCGIKRRLPPTAPPPPTTTTSPISGGNSVLTKSEQQSRVQVVRFSSVAVLALWTITDLTLEKYQSSLGPNTHNRRKEAQNPNKFNNARTGNWGTSLSKYSLKFLDCVSSTLEKKKMSHLLWFSSSPHSAEVTLCGWQDVKKCRC